MKPTRLKAKCQFSVRNRDVHSDVPLLSLLCSALVSHCHRLLVGGGDGLVCESVGKAGLFSDHFGSKQARESVDLPLTCHPSPRFTTFAFRSSEVRPLLSDLDPYGGTTPLGMFPIFLKKTADVLEPRLSEVFRRLVRLGSFPTCRRQANVTIFRRSIVLPCCQLPTYFHNISIFQGV